MPKPPKIPARYNTPPEMQEVFDEIVAAVAPPDGDGGISKLAEHFNVSSQAVAKWRVDGLPGYRAMDVAELTGIPIERIFVAVRKPEHIGRRRKSDAA